MKSVLQPSPSALSPGASFRVLLDNGPLLLPGVFNAITAKIAEQAGFSALYLSGAGVTNSLTAFPDIALLTLTEMAQQSRYVSGAVTCPVIADADTGYGEVLNVARTVQEMESAGLAGIHIEDQVAPKRCGHLEGKQVIDAADMASKVSAAVRSRRDPNFFIIARTDARTVNGLDDAIARANRYRDAGADAIFAESLRSESEFVRFAKEVSGPLMANMTEFGMTPLTPFDKFAEMGYAMVLYPMTAFRVMMRAAFDVYRELKTTGTQLSYLDKMQTRQELYELIQYDLYKDFDNKNR